MTDLLPARWQQIERLYNGALDRGVTEREAFLAQACGDDEELRQEVRSLLGYEDAPPIRDFDPDTHLIERRLAALDR